MTVQGERSYVRVACSHDIRSYPSIRSRSVCYPLWPLFVCIYFLYSQVLEWFVFRPNNLGYNWHGCPTWPSSARDLSCTSGASDRRCAYQRSSYCTSHLLSLSRPHRISNPTSPSRVVARYFDRSSDVCNTRGFTPLPYPQSTGSSNSDRLLQVAGAVDRQPKNPKVTGQSQFAYAFL